MSHQKLSPDDWVDRFYNQHPKLKKWRPEVELREGSGEARQQGAAIFLFPKFWKLPPTTKNFVFTHEIGHFVLRGRYPELLKVAQDRGVDVWDTSSLPYSQFNGEEAFADCFASYILTPQELHDRYPQWVSIVQHMMR